MGDSSSTFIDELKRDLYGKQVGETHALVCDYCDAEVSITEPVMYEARRVGDMPEFKKAIDIPEEWRLDAARCHNCKIESLKPATNGFDEALILVSVTESNAILSIDTAQMSVVDISSDGNGYHPPQIGDPSIHVFTSGDLRYARWTRMKGVLNGLDPSETPTKFVEAAQRIIEQSKEVPPGIHVESL